MMPRSTPRVVRFMLLSWIVTVPGPAMELKRIPVAPPTVSLTVLLVILTIAEGASDIWKAVPLAALNCARLLKIVTWPGPASDRLSAVSVPPVEVKALFVKAIFESPVVAALLIRTPVFVPPLAAKTELSIAADRVPFQPRRRPAEPMCVFVSEFPWKNRFIVEPWPPAREVRSMLSAEAELKVFPVSVYAYVPSWLNCA